MSKIPSGLAKQQDIQRQKSINLVLRAIADLNAEGHHIRIKDLMEHTGLSRSIFGKPHIRQILVNKGICIDPALNDVPLKVSSKKASRISNLEKKLRQKEEYIQRLVDENSELKDECALLRGKLFLLMQQRI